MPQDSTTEKIWPGRFDGKVVIITGAAAGLGKATAERLAREGASLVLVDLSKQLEATRAEVEGLAAGGKVIAVTADVSKE